MSFGAVFLTLMGVIFSVAKRMRRTLPIRIEFETTRMAPENLASAYEFLVPEVRRDVADGQTTVSEKPEKRSRVRGLRVRR